MQYDIIVVGAGHAGVEASLAAARMGKKTLLLTILVDKIAAASCNPAIGGLAKGHLVKELDALGGQMALITDKVGLQFRILNTSKGPAVRGSRAQIDMDQYSIEARNILFAQENLDILQELVLELIIEDNIIKGLKTNLGNTYKAQSVILTTGTFLNGLVHVGQSKISAGRFNEIPSVDLANQIKDLGFEVSRLKTGTCPRLDGSTIDFDKLEKQDNEEQPKPFSFRTDTKSFNPKQMPCYIGYTNEVTHSIIASNFHLAPLFSGQIKGVGPRYCPSVEDKINRFKDKARHQLFIEPQTMDATEYYINGLSTSLPANIQQTIVNSIKGLEKAKIIRYGYAIEYDFIQPTELEHTLETKKISNLYFAGQINGTTGYEEAAAQGLIAGINAVLKLDAKDPFILNRNEAYIGVLIDDLVTKGTNEPYRMFTSRAEFRLLLREDNADRRLLDYARRIGLVDQEYLQRTTNKDKLIKDSLQTLQETFLTPSKATLDFLASIGESTILEKTSLKNFISRHHNTVRTLEALRPEIAKLDEVVKEQIVIDAKYDHYIKKQNQQILQMQDYMKIKIPNNFAYKDLIGLSSEALEKLEKIRPKNLFSASQISGITPSALDILYVKLHAHKKYSNKHKEKKYIKSAN